VPRFGRHVAKFENKNRRSHRRVVRFVERDLHIDAAYLNGRRPSDSPSNTASDSRCAREGTTVRHRDASFRRRGFISWRRGTGRDYFVIVTTSNSRDTSMTHNLEVVRVLYADNRIPLRSSLFTPRAMRVYL